MFKILVIGCGSIGRRHIQNLLTLNAGVITAFDLAPSARAQVTAELGVTVIDDLSLAWSSPPDIALITTPTQFHLANALAAAAHHAHLFIEKPLSYRMDGLAALQTEVARHDLISMIGCNMRFHPGPAQVKQLLDAQRIGQIISARIYGGSYLPGWHPQSDYHSSYSASPEWGGMILDGIHEIDLTSWYFGPAHLLAAAKIPAHTLGLETDGVAEILLRHDTRVLSSVHLNFVQRDYHRGCEIIGADGTIYWDWSRHCVQLYGANGQLQETFPEPEAYQVNQMYVDELTYFLNCVCTHTPTMNPISAAAETLQLALDARAQAQVVA